MKRKNLIFITTIFFTLHSANFAKTIQNDTYILDIDDKGNVSVSLKGNSSVPAQKLTPEFTVLYSKKDPGYNINHRNYMLAPRTAIRWSNYEEDMDSLNAWLKTDEAYENCGAIAEITKSDNGKRIWTYKDKSSNVVKLIVNCEYANGTTNPFVVGEKFVLKAVSSKIVGNTVTWSFKDSDKFDFSACITLPEKDGAIIISHTFTAKTKGYFSAAYTGIEGIDKNLAKWLPQEVNGRDYHQYNHLVHEGMLKLPKAQITTDKFTTALVVDSSHTKFKVADKTNAEYGIMMSLENGKFKPIAFAPIMGGPNSKMKDGDESKFKIHYILNAQTDWRNTYTHIAQRYYKFKDMRDNSGSGSLNSALEASIDYLINADGNNYAMWHDEQKYYDYFNDNTTIFKPFSLLYGLSAAVITDDLEFFEKRVYPHTEFTLSRTSNIFAPYEAEFNNQVKSRNRGLGYSYASAAELLGIASFYGMKNPYIKNMILSKGFQKSSINDSIAQYELGLITKENFDAEIKNLEKKFKDEIKVKFTYYSDLLDAYSASQSPILLEAATRGAYSQSTLMNLSPEVPDELFVSEKDNQVPIHAHSFGRHISWGFPEPKPFALKEQKVPAWRVALTGLESPAYRGEYWMHHHGQLLRIGTLANDVFLKDLARWGMIGRFGMFAGDNRSSFSLIAEQRDVVNHPIWELTFATVNPGHAWEFAGELLDFLISDAFDKSGMNIDFPHRVMPESPFRVRVYGDRPGKFYNIENVNLWMPKKLFKIDNQQIDWVSGYVSDKFCIAFLNQSFSEETFTVNFDKSKLLLGPLALRLDKGFENQNYKVNDNTLTLSVKPKSILTLVVEGSKIQSKLRSKMLDSSRQNLTDASFKIEDESFGKVYAYLISMGKGLTKAHIYTDSLPNDTISTTLKYKIDDGKWQSLTDAVFPYEYTLKIPDEVKELELQFVHEDKFQKVKTSKSITLKK